MAHWAPDRFLYSAVWVARRNHGRVAPAVYGFDLPKHARASWGRPSNHGVPSVAKFGGAYSIYLNGAAGNAAGRLNHRVATSALVLPAPEGSSNSIEGSGRAPSIREGPHRRR